LKRQVATPIERTGAAALNGKQQEKLADSPGFTAIPSMTPLALRSPKGTTME
jgi:hypothetical protein